MPSWLQIPKWTTLRGLGSSSVLRSSYFWLLIVPVTARLLSQLDSPLQLTLFGQRHSVELSLPFSWFHFYFAAVAFSVASFLFAIFCPRLIKEFSSFQDYYQAGNGARLLGECLLTAPIVHSREHRQIVGHELESALKRSQVPISSEYEGEILHDPFSEEFGAYFAALRREELGDLFYVAVTAYDGAHHFVRFLATVFYGLGFILTFIVVAQGFMFVFNSFAASLHK